MSERSDLIEELLWDLDQYYPEHELLEEAWEIFNEEDDLPTPMIKKLKRLLKRATGEAA